MEGMTGKRVLYVGLFMFLGFLLQMLVHAWLEIEALAVMMALGEVAPWHLWPGWHTAVSLSLMVLGLLFGWWQGEKWWHLLYVKKWRYRWRKRRSLRR